MTSTSRSAAALRAAADRLSARVDHWNPGRWSQPVDPGEPAVTRADVVFALVCRLEARCARGEGRSSHPVPRLDNDLAIPDQVRVMVNDLLATPDGDHLDAAAHDIAETTAILTG